MNRLEFIKYLANINNAISITGKKYNSINVVDNKVFFTREGKKNSEYILISELYNFFINESNYNTAIAKNYISGRVQSPSVAILNELKKLITKNNNSIHNESNKTVPDKLSDEKKFFKIFSKIIGTNFLLSKNIEKPVTSEQIFLSSFFLDYEFDEKIIKIYEKILSELNSTKNFKSYSLSHLIDGFIIDHPIFGNRIVEFDEEQHFTPARLETLHILKKSIKLPYLDTYIKICNDLNYLNSEVLTKHRISLKLETYPSSFNDFLKFLKSPKIKESGYIESKNGFEFKGGRIAQRAYYDCLRDTAHLSPKNKSLDYPLRFPKRLFELKTNLSFSSINNDDIKTIIKEILKEVYNLL